MKRAMQRDGVAHAVLILGVLLFLLPVWLLVAGATQDAGQIARGGLSLIPNPAGLGIFWSALFFGSAAKAGYPVWHMLMISFAMAMAIAVGKICISLLSAFAVVFFRFPFRKLAFWTIFLTLMLPVEVRIIPSYAVVSDLGLVNHFGGLTLPLIASATATLLFRQIFTALPDELVEAARLDGAGPLVFLKDIVIPVSRANIAALFVILFVYGWNQYLWPLLAASSPAYTTIVLGIVQLISPEQMTPWNIVMATTVLALLPPIAVVLALQGAFVRGLTEVDK
jgi:sn-glycerol 3-phosphate transport system permease protein